jgi:4-hydroxybenzoate polyprenyltransferase
MFKKLRHTLEMIKFSHSIFALPFALSAMVVAAEGWPDWKTVALIVAAMVTARNTAMSLNRFIDRDVDAQNPRTRNRHLPQKILSPQYVFAFGMLNALFFMGICFFINDLSYTLSLPTLAFIIGYSWVKRFSSLTQLYLGLCLGIAPVGAWIAVTGAMTQAPIILGGAILFWVAGFDIIYAAQDHEFDKQHNLHSLVVLLGIPKALFLSKLFHVLTIILLVFFGHTANLGMIYFITCGLVALLLGWEQSLVKPNDLSRINMAFFTFNGIIGLLFLAGVIADRFFTLP